MSKIVTAIDITFENLDNVVIPVDYFVDFSIEDVHISVERMAVNAILKRKYADYIRFELKRSVNSVLFDLDPDLSSDWFEDRLTEIIARGQNITSLALCYSDESTETFYVLWEDGVNEYRNRLQHSQYNAHGNLEITISKHDTPK